MIRRSIAAIARRLQKRGMGVSSGRDKFPVGYSVQDSTDVWFSEGSNVAYQVARFALASDAKEFVAMKREAT